MTISELFDQFRQYHEDWCEDRKSAVDIESVRAEIVRRVRSVLPPCTPWTSVLHRGCTINVYFKTGLVTYATLWPTTELDRLDARYGRPVECAPLSNVFDGLDISEVPL